MKLAFWRRSRGRHALGAAVTSIPSLRTPELPTPPPALVGAVPPQAQYVVAEPVVASPEPDVAPVSVDLLDLAVPDLAPLEPAPLDEVPLAALGPTGPRVELGFRDGSRAALDPSSEQYRALEDIASVLTRRD